MVIKPKIEKMYEDLVDLLSKRPHFNRMDYIKKQYKRYFYNNIYVYMVAIKRIQDQKNKKLQLHLEA